MNTSVDYAAFEIGLARVKLREDLRFTLHGTDFATDGTTSSADVRDRWYIIEDEANSKFYRVGHAEYVFLSLLDGRTTIQSAIAETSAELGKEAFSEDEAAALCKWLVDTDLADKHRNDHDQWLESQKKQRMARRSRWINPIMLKIPLGNPDKAAGKLTNYFGWMISPSVGVTMVLLWCFAILILLPRLDELFTPTDTILSSSNWIWLGSCWLILRVVHESAHAVTCKRFGGVVREWGILWLMFIPLPYVDVTSSWRFPLRRGRILTSAAGMIAELTIAACAAIVWANADSPLIRQNAVNVMMAASFTTLMFNANPLMRFDGYHILADLLNAPNFWTHGRQYMRGVGRRLFFDLLTPDPPWQKRHVGLGKLYGFASVVWTSLIFVSLSLGALSLVDGIGIVLALIAIALWLGLPLVRLVRFLVFGGEFETPNRKRFVVATTVLVLGLVMIGSVTPAPSVVNAPITILHEPLTTIRAESAGFVNEYSVQPGQHVAEGDVLCTLENVELEAELRDVSHQLAASVQRVRAFQSAGEPAAAQRELESTNDLSRRREELAELVAQLQIRAPVSGVILNDNLSDRIGHYLRRGEEIVTLGGSDAINAIGLVSQQDAHLLTDVINEPVDIRIWGAYGAAYEGRIRRVSPRAQTTLPHFAFAAAYGGPLAVVANDPIHDLNRSDDSATPASQWQLVDPRVNVEIEIDRSESHGLRTGQTGLVHVRARHSRLGSYVISGVFRYLKDRIHRTHGI